VPVHPHSGPDVLANGGMPYGYGSVLAVLVFAHFAKVIDRDRSPLDTAVVQSQPVTLKAGKHGNVFLPLNDSAICVNVECQHGKAIPLELFYSNDCFREMALQDGWPRSTTITVLKRAKCCSVTGMIS
jgi:hypothetical protein